MDATVDISFFLSRCEREFTATEFILTASNKIHADGLRRCCRQVAKWVNRPVPALSSISQTSRYLNGNQKKLNQR